MKQGKERIKEQKKKTNKERKKNGLYVGLISYVPKQKKKVGLLDVGTSLQAVAPWRPKAKETQHPL